MWCWMLTWPYLSLPVGKCQLLIDNTTKDTGLGKILLKCIKVKDTDTRGAVSILPNPGPREQCSPPWGPSTCRVWSTPGGQFNRKIEISIDFSIEISIEFLVLHSTKKTQLKSQLRFQFLYLIALLVSGLICAVLVELLLHWAAR